MLIEIAIILALIVLNGVFSMSEIAIVSSRKSRLEHALQRGSKRAKTALDLANSPNTFLSTVQIGITLIGILTGVFGGASIAEKLTVYLDRVPFLTRYSGPLSLFLVVLLITFLSLVIGELVPKRIAMHNPESIAKTVAGPMRAISKITAPFVWLLSKSTDLVLKVLRLKPSDEPAVTEEEVRSMIAQGTTTGMFEPIEQDIVDRVFRMSDRKAGSLMTPRIDIDWLDMNDSYQEIKEQILASAHSSFPLCRSSLDEVIGIIHAKTFFKQPDSFHDMTSIMDKAIFIPENMKAFHVLEKFKEANIRIAIVVDEYGTVQGLVTLKDLFISMVGEIEREHSQETQILEREDGSYLVDGLVSFDDFVEYFKVSNVYVNEDAGFNTIGGLIIDIAGRIPHAGETFTWHNLAIEVLDMDGTRVDKVLVRLFDNH